MTQFSDLLPRLRKIIMYASHCLAAYFVAHQTKGNGNNLGFCTTSSPEELGRWRGQLQRSPLSLTLSPLMTKTAGDEFKSGKRRPSPIPAFFTRSTGSYLSCNVPSAPHQSYQLIPIFDIRLLCLFAILLRRSRSRLGLPVKSEPATPTRISLKRKRSSTEHEEQDYFRTKGERAVRVSIGKSWDDWQQGKFNLFPLKSLPTDSHL